MSALLFNAAFGFYVVGLIHSVLAFAAKRALFHRLAIGAVAVAFALHTAFLVHAGLEARHLPLAGLKESLALFAWAVTLAFLIACYRYRIQALGLFVLPLVAALMLGTSLIESSPMPAILRTSWLYLHSFFLFLAYGMFFVTFVAGILYLLQENELKHKRPKMFFHRLPSLELLDDLFLKSLIIGFLFMTVGLLAGVLWARQEWGTGWSFDAKVIAALATWAIYLALTFLRVSMGWRGRRAAAISTAGFLSVLFTYLGASYFGTQHVF